MSPREAWTYTSAPPHTTLDPVTPPHSRLLALLLFGVALPLSSCGGTVDEDPGARIVRIEGNNRDICATRVDGKVFCFDTWEVNDQGNPVPVLGLPAPSSMSVGYDYACAIAGKGEVWCWRFVRGGFRTIASTPTRFDLPGSASHVACSEGHCCAATTAGEVWCWLAPRNTAEARKLKPGEPHRIDLGGRRANQVTAGSGLSCASVDDGTVICWVDTVFWRPGDGEVPFEVPAVRGATRLVGSMATVCALAPGEPVRCWGISPFPIDDRRLSVPTEVPHFGRTVSLAVSPYGACGLRDDEKVHCVGLPPYDGTQAGPPIGNGPSGVTELPNGVTAIAMAGWKACALDRTGSVWCWGKNSVHRGSSVPERIAFPR